MCSTWKAPILRNAYEHNKYPDDYGMGRGLEYSWKRERPDLTYEDYWIWVCLIGHATYRKYQDSHYKDVDIIGGT